MTRGVPEPIGTRVKRSNGRWQVKCGGCEEHGHPLGVPRWHWEPRKRRDFGHSVVVHGFSDEEWTILQAIAHNQGDSVSALTRSLLGDLLAAWGDDVEYDACGSPV